MSRQDFPDCVEGEKGNELSNELSNMAWSVLALRINGWRYAGMLEAGAVTKAVCGRAKCCSVHAVLRTQEHRVRRDGGKE
ncbi:unnamed protein product [Vitrella brassicaformis CCMP3155]|uniref:Uncharacterized protein n=1 Tax=Vitrella brassicaformis (strain CCMP3155) TaxID=1169540 RepID=A0A0G4ES40_VITBC|nr:unnamed protein product [Vitrella brassicaformis CCMP3155]|eukprot:CEM00864.1 unnamed protein product [Vitrella brassicaformis CCMP3155]